MVSMTDLHWLAGLLEGEGSFVNCRHKYPGGREYEQFVIQVCMTDKDPVEKVGRMLGGVTSEQKHRTKANKPVYRTAVQGARAIGWMQTLYPLMGVRRRAKIAECIRAFNESPGKTSMTKYAKRYMAKEAA